MIGEETREEGSTVGWRDALEAPKNWASLSLGRRCGMLFGEAPESQREGAAVRDFASRMLSLKGPEEDRLRAL